MVGSPIGVALPNVRGNVANLTNHAITDTITDQIVNT